MAYYLIHWHVFGVFFFFFLVVATGHFFFHLVLQKGARLLSFVQYMESTFIYRLKLEPGEETAKMSASGLALYRNTTRNLLLGQEQRIWRRGCHPYFLLLFRLLEMSVKT